jgi:hypothetical protein
VGSKFYLSYPELDVTGDAEVLAIHSCPPIPARPSLRHCLVTSKFTHDAAEVLDLSVEGVAGPIGVTPNHPIWSDDRREFVRASDLAVGESLLDAQGARVAVREIVARSGLTEVFNLEVDGEHVYHVSSAGVLVHNDCASNVASNSGLSAKGVHDKFVNKVRPGARERVFDTPWSTNKGLGSRKFDDFDEITMTGFEGNTTPWSSMTQEQLSRKLDQVGSDFALLRNGDVKRIIWFGTEPLPTKGLGGQLREALQKAGIEYWVVIP